ncbi:5'-methylthioadenosine/adenosylhomocysteine nucleosidase [Acetobacterium wieringae]|uniref:adenosylhomocysteine nucleosidase n=1 Tax=Acetobacterium wieringae TaxID=52694 RepID=A0ABY6HFY7_9FIRM|nr:5'-methylthioadenosine/adenosylhomocysteine nucleosidase [Acetobacterium wieringae]UYO63210.1 5'-methylthioadenosine/adenosylhomocysteine nucleosidase [Acetobacterium wieringae]VUZ23778.1 Aminodeoxyfutalosine nucleosidase [Acetobacterium wieringae]
MIGIIAAMDSEVRDIKAAMEDGIKVHHGGMTFFKGKLHQKEVVAVKSGIGKVNAAMCAQVLIDIFKVTAIINVGVAGAVHPELEIGDIVISEDSCQYDMDARAFGHPRGEIPNMDITFFKADSTLIKLAVAAAQDLGATHRVGRIMTADLGVNSNQLKQELLEEFGGLCVEMEGAAVGQVAMLNQVPYLVIRSMSDKADSNLTDDYKANLEASIKNGVAMVLKMVQEVPTA